MIVSLPIVDYLLTHFSEKIQFDIVNCHNIQMYEDILGPERRAKIGAIFPDSSSLDYPSYHAAAGMHEIVLIDATPKILDNYPNFRRFHNGDYMYYGGALGPLSNRENFPFINHQAAELGLKLGLNRITMPQWSIGMPPPYVYPKITPVISALPHISLPERYITINDGWNATFKTRMTKAYPVERWVKFIELAQKEGLKVVQIGSIDVGEDLPVDLNLRGQTTLAESFYILSESDCHVDIEGGLVHAAAALGIRSVVMHGPTDREFFSYSQNINLAVPGACQNCWWLLPRWAESCIARKDAECMKHDPQVVLNSVLEIINSPK